MEKSQSSECLKKSVCVYRAAAFEQISRFIASYTEQWMRGHWSGSSAASS